MGRPGHTILKWDQLRDAQAVYLFSGMRWKKGLVTKTYENSCTVLFEDDNKRNASVRIIDLENVRSGLGYSDET